MSTKYQFFDIVPAVIRGDASVTPFRTVEDASAYVEALSLREDASDPSSTGWALTGRYEDSQGMRLTDILAGSINKADMIAAYLAETGNVIDAGQISDDTPITDLPASIEGASEAVRDDTTDTADDALARYHEIHDLISEEVEAGNLEGRMDQARYERLVDLLAAAAADTPMPEPQRPGPKKAFSHVLDMAFSYESDDPAGDDVPAEPQAVYAAVRARLADIFEFDGQGAVIGYQQGGAEAFGVVDTDENEIEDESEVDPRLSAMGWSEGYARGARGEGWWLDILDAEAIGEPEPIRFGHSIEDGPFLDAEHLLRFIQAKVNEDGSRLHATALSIVSGRQREIAQARQAAENGNDLDALFDRIGWSNALNTAANAEGWTLNCIEDESGEHFEVLPIMDGAGDIGNQEEAEAHVRAKAREGSELHRKALEIAGLTLEPNESEEEDDDDSLRLA